MTARFRQVDLEIEAEESLALICEDFAKVGVFELHHSRTTGGYLVVFELPAHWEGGEPTNDPDELIAEFCLLIEGLSTAARETWNRAFRKTLDVAFDLTGESRRFESGISVSTLSKMATVGASLAVTIHPPSEEHEPVVIL